MKFKKITLLLAISAFAFSVNGQNNMELTKKQQSLVTISATEAKGDINALTNAIDDGLSSGLTVSEIKEALSQLYAYTGFPRALNGLSTLQEVIAKRTDSGVSLVEEKAYEYPDGFDALKSGTAVQTKLCGGKPFDYKFAPRMDYYLKAHLFGDIFASDVLNEADREIVTISALSALSGCESQLISHVGGSLNMGVSMAQLQAIPLVLEQNIGAIESYRVRKAIALVQGKPVEEGEPVDFAIWPKGELNTGFANYFIGNSYLAPLDAQNGGPINVTFEPRCRNNWHIHHNSVQVLICVAGRGWYQEQGKEPVEMKVGSVIAIPAGVKHWHGAAQDSWFQHLTYTTMVGENAGTEWLEPVVDEVYNKLK